MLKVKVASRPEMKHRSAKGQPCAQSPYETKQKKAPGLEIRKMVSGPEVCMKNI